MTGFEGGSLGPAPAGDSEEVSASQLFAAVAKAEKVAADLESRGATYLYDGVYVYHDGYQYWLCTESGDRVALEPRTMDMFLEHVKRREGEA